jgi:nicotinamidase-related amidase
MAPGRRARRARRNTVHRTPFKNLVPPAPPLRLVEQRAALLVVDFQTFAAERTAGLGRLAAERGIEDELEEYYEQVGFARRNVRGLLRGFRARRLPVLFTRRLSAEGTAPPWVPAADDATAAIVPELEPGAGEAVVTRAATSPFAGGMLDAALGAADAGALVVTGLVLGGAVDAAVREAAERGHAVVLVSDACAAETLALHECVTGQLAGGPVRVRPTEAVLAMLDGAQ